MDQPYWGFFIVIVIFRIEDLLALPFTLSKSLIYGSLGGILSAIVQTNKFDIDYKVDKSLLKFEPIKLVILSNVVSVIGGLAIQSKIVFSNSSGEDAFIKLVYVLCGYSQTHIPHLLKNFEIKSKDE
jgi:hypothetical protein